MKKNMFILIGIDMFFCYVEFLGQDTTPAMSVVLISNKDMSMWIRL